MVCSNNVTIVCHFFHTATFTVYVTASRAPNLKKSFMFGKQLRLKTIDTFPSMYTLSIVNTCEGPSGGSRAAAAITDGCREVLALPSPEPGDCSRSACKQYVGRFGV